MPDKMREWYVFALTEEHLKLMAALDFDVWLDTPYDEQIVPAINLKRPFGNGGTEEEVCRILRWPSGPNAERPAAQLEQARNLLAELPLALAVVMRYRSFEPMAYHLDEAYFGLYISRMVCAKNYLELSKPLKELQQLEACESVYATVRSMCRNVFNRENPYEVLDFLRESLAREPAISGLREAVEVFERHKARYEAEN